MHGGKKALIENEGHLTEGGGHTASELGILTRAAHSNKIFSHFLLKVSYDHVQIFKISFKLHFAPQKTLQISIKQHL